jgi:hypothetical protein
MAAVPGWADACAPASVPVSCLKREKTGPVADPGRVYVLDPWCAPLAHAGSVATTSTASWVSGTKTPSRCRKPAERTSTPEWPGNARGAGRVRPEGHRCIRDVRL